MFYEFLNDLSFIQRTLLLIVLLISLSYASAAASAFISPLRKNLKEHREWADSMISSLSWGLVFLLAVTISNAWSNMGEATNVAIVEAAKIKALTYELNIFFPEEKERVFQSIVNYTKSIQVDEWHDLNKGKANLKTEHCLSQLYQAVAKLSAKSRQQKIAYKNMLSIIPKLIEIRDQRLSKQGSFLPEVLRDSILFLSYVICILLGLIRREYSLLGIWPILFFCMLIAVLISLVVEFDYPFSGPTETSSGVYNQVFELISLKHEPLHPAAK